MNVCRYMKGDKIHGSIKFNDWYFLLEALFYYTSPYPY